jgi:hypothetical protein
MSLKDFDNLNFIAKVGVEKGRPKNDGSGENYPDKNTLLAAIGPDKKDWHPVEQLPPFNGGSGGGGGAAPSTPTQGVKKPDWAT